MRPRDQTDDASPLRIFRPWWTRTANCEASATFCFESQPPPDTGEPRSTGTCGELKQRAFLERTSTSGEHRQAPERHLPDPVAGVPRRPAADEGVRSQDRRDAVA